MQRVIDIDEETFNKLPNAELGSNTVADVLDAVEEGTPLSKGHGRILVVLEDIIKKEQISLDFSCQKWVSEVGLSNATIAIIEADKESEE